MGTWRASNPRGKSQPWTYQGGHAELGCSPEAQGSQFRAGFRVYVWGVGFGGVPGSWLARFRGLGFDTRNSS